MKNRLSALVQTSGGVGGRFVLLVFLLASFSLALARRWELNDVERQSIERLLRDLGPASSACLVASVRTSSIFFSFSPASARMAPATGQSWDRHDRWRRSPRLPWGSSSSSLRLTPILSLSALVASSSF